MCLSTYELSRYIAKLRIIKPYENNYLTKWLEVLRLKSSHKRTKRLAPKAEKMVKELQLVVGT